MHIKKYMYLTKYQDENLNIDKKIISIEDKIDKSNQVFMNLKEDAISFYNDLYLPNKMLNNAKINDLLKIGKVNPFKNRETKKMIKELESNFNRTVLYSEKQDYLIIKVYDYFNYSSEIESNFKKSISNIKEAYFNNDIDIPEEIHLHLKKIEREFFKIEKKYSFLGSNFKRYFAKFKKDMSAPTFNSYDYINSSQNIETMKKLLPFLQENIFHSKKEIIGSYPLLSMQYSSVKDNVFFLKSNINKKNYSTKDTINLIKETNFKINDLLLNFSKEYRYKTLINKTFKQISYVPRELDIRNSTLIYELDNKKYSGYRNNIEYINKISRLIKQSYEDIISFENQTLLKYNVYAKLFNIFFDRLEEYLKYTNKIAKEINQINKSKQDINNVLSQISIELLDCEWKIKNLPEFYTLKYQGLIDNYSQKTNILTKEFKNQDILFNESDYSQVNNFFKVIRVLKSNIYTELYLLKNIEYAIQKLYIYNEENKDNEDLENYISNIEDTYFSGEINSTLRLIIKVLDLYNINL